MGKLAVRQTGDLELEPQSQKSLNIIPMAPIMTPVAASRLAPFEGVFYLGVQHCEEWTNSQISKTL